MMVSGRNALIDVRSVSQVFPELRGSAGVQALSDVSMSIGEREFVCVIGPSGCGKTTLLNMVAGFIHPSTGEILVDGRPVRSPGPDRGVVFQEIGLFPWLTAKDNVEFGLKMSGVSSHDRRLKASKVLEMTGLSDAADRYPHELSGGMKQRVGIARVLANDPRVLLMDEPFGALDSQTRTLMQEELARVWLETGKTVLFITHAIDEAIFLADRVVVMTARPGRVKSVVDIDLSRPRDETSSEFNELRRELRGLVLTEATVD